MVNSGAIQQYSTQEEHHVKQVRFGVLSREEILAMSVAEVTQIRVNDFETHQPLKGGLNDPRMGVCTSQFKCLTCEGNNLDCVGHFGHMELAVPIYHPGFLDVVKKILVCVCYKCSKLKIDESNKVFYEIQKIKNGSKRMTMMAKHCQSVRKCAAMEEESLTEKIRHGCGCEQPKFQLAKLKITINQSQSNEDEANKQRDFQAQEALDLFKKITDEDCKYMGLDPQTSRPENLIITVLPVAPPPVRPSVQMNSTQRSEDDLTHQYMTILKINQEIKNKIEKGTPPSQLESKIDNLQYFVATLFNNEMSGVPKASLKSKRPIKSIRERLKGKEGRLRKNLMGKRVDFSARTVVSPDPNLAIDELGIPKSMALNLTFPETVTPLNIEKMRTLVINGPTSWPGAKTLIRNDGKQFDLRYAQDRENITLDYGDIIERHIVDGDYVVFNRQPSLHRMSMMGHRIKILPFSSFRLNLSVTSPYNADFDGDEMNMHCPQSYQTISEIKNIMHVPRQIVSPQANRPVMGIVQDSCLGIRIMTRRNTFLTKEQVMNLMLWIEDFHGDIPPPAILKPQPLWTGKQLISLILPQINLEHKCIVAPKEADENKLLYRDMKILIERGELLAGMLDKGVVGSSSGGLLHYIWLDYGPEAAAKFLTSAQRIVNNWLLLYGFSVGCSDIFIDEECKEAVDKHLSQEKDIVPKFFKLAEQKKMDFQPGKSIMDSFEANVNQELNNIFKLACNEAQDKMSDKNRFYCMVASGSKGSNLNIAQTMACVGQQNVEGRRIPYGFFRRTLPCFRKDDYGPQSRGFVLNSYLSGLSPQEFFFHAMGGREGLIDTAVKTSETGYVQRKLIKALEDVMVKYDSTVRDSSSNIVQFVYGEDGMSGEFIEGQLQSFVTMKDKELEKEFRMFDPEDDRDISDQLQKYERVFDHNVIESLLSSPPIILEEFHNEYQQIKFYRDELRRIFPNFDNKIHLPLNLSRLIKTVKTNNRLKYGSGQHLNQLNPLDVIRDVNQTIQKLVISEGSDFISKESQQNSIYLLSIMIKLFLSSKRVCIRENLLPDIFYEILGEIESKFNQAKVHPNEMIGIICAQSLGEPTTQMTLNTFHFAGVSSKNVTLGVPRLKEILSVAKNIKTPSMMIYIDPEQQSSLEIGEELAKRLQTKLEDTTLTHLATVSELYYDPEFDNTIIEADVILVQDYMMLPDDDDVDKVSSWMLRIELDKNALIDRKFDCLKEIKDKITSRMPFVQIIYDAVVMPDYPVLRIRLKSEEIPADKQILALRTIEQQLLDDLRLKGLPNIKKVFMKKNKRKYVEEVSGSIKDQEEWMLETDGSNLRSVLSVELVDHRRTTTNDCLEVYNVLGVEAARQSIIKEIRMILDVYGIYVNYRHLTTLADIMTQRGQLNSVSRHGINRAVEGAFRRASFEETVEILFHAGVFCDIQNFNGITENIMFGQLAPLGSGAFDLILDVKQLRDVKSIPSLNIIDDEMVETFEQQFDDYDTRMTPNRVDMPTPSQGKTPVYGFDTPSGMTPNYIGQSPGIMNQFTPFTPNRGYVASPDYFKGQKIEDSPAFTSMNQNMQAVSPAYKISSPLYNSPHSSTGSPKYSPQSNQMLQYSPTSPGYNPASISPSYSSGTGTNRIYSPSSPGYSINYIPSPYLNQNQSPSSPKYSSQSPMTIKNSPSTPNMSSGQHQQIQSPISPAYNIAATNYNPQSPVYDASNKNVPLVELKQEVISEEEEEYDEEEEDEEK